MTPHWNEMQSPALKQSLHLSVHLRNSYLTSWQKEFGLLIYLEKKKKKKNLVLTQPSTLIWRLSSRVSKKEFSHNRAYGWVTDYRY